MRLAIGSSNPVRIFWAAISVLVLLGCQPSVPSLKTRAETIPPDAVKMTPETDFWPPILCDSAHWEQPVPVHGRVNTAGAEDSPFVTPDGQNLYFFFTPDPDIPAERQVIDRVTGIWWSKRSGDTWCEPERVFLGEVEALDGCEFVQGDTMWFASVRRGNYSEIDIYSARLRNGVWGDVRNVGRRLSQTLDIGEFHVSRDWQTVYFHANRPGGYGDLDIWKVGRSGDTWGTPENLGPAINSSGFDGWPYLSQDGKELWITRPGPSLWRAELKGGEWQEPQEVMRCFAAEASLDNAGNLYFCHHFYDTLSHMIEADIYVARPKVRMP
ncbi:MAG: hypothetical protein ABIK62_02565 [candidate division WOR-3 bacterium]